MYPLHHQSKWTLKNKLNTSIYKECVNKAFSSCRNNCQLNYGSMTKFESLFLYPEGCTCICMYKSLSICTYKSLYRTRWDITKGHHKEVTALFHFHWKVITIKQLNYADNLNLILLHTKSAAAEKTELLQKPSSFDSSVISYKRITYESRTFSTWVFPMLFLYFYFFHVGLISEQLLITGTEFYVRS